MASPRFLVGIDLGTTNTVVAYCEITDDLQQSPVSLFDIDQLIGPGEVVRKPLLPSFRYHPAQGQIAQNDLTLPWDVEPVAGDIGNVIVGEWHVNSVLKWKVVRYPVLKVGFRTKL